MTKDTANYPKHGYAFAFRKKRNERSIKDLDTQAKNSLSVRKNHDFINVLKHWRISEGIKVELEDIRRTSFCFTIL
jgi:hypothetical protein